MIRSARLIFVLTILTGSFLLFLVQPLVARMALPLLGGAPNVWNSAMLVYQALLLGGYFYAHLLSRFAPRRQAMIHIALMLLAALTLPIALADLPPPRAGWEALWVPALLAATIGPLFLLVAAQAPLMQSWFAADDRAGDPYWLYAASNIGSFAGLLCYPLLIEPSLPLAGQSFVWAVGYGLLLLLVTIAAATRWRSALVKSVPDDAAHNAAPESIPPRRIAYWIVLAAVPSGLMLSTTTHLTTDLFAMPLLWVVPLGLYLLSFVFAFKEHSYVTAALSRPAPVVLLLGGGMAMLSRGNTSLALALASLLILFVIAVALHGQLYRARPNPARLTFFYLMMSAGGVIGGAFTALIAPLLFDWTWEHPLLVLASAALLAPRPLLDWMGRLQIGPVGQRQIRLALLLVAAVLSMFLFDVVAVQNTLLTHLLTFAIVLLGIAGMGTRWLLVATLLALMLGRGGYDTIMTSVEGLRERSYFGVYTVRSEPDLGERLLVHGTTLHGRQLMGPRRLAPTTYYTRDSGVGLALLSAPELYGADARIGVVGLGVGTLACYRERGQRWDFFEIDPAVYEYSLNGTFTYLRECAPEAEVHIGDARLVLEGMAGADFDILAIDAFTSDAIPLHLLTREALDIYAGSLAQDGILLFHISNRFIDLRPILAAHAAERGWVTLLRDARPVNGDKGSTGSLWVAMSRDSETLARLLQAEPEASWMSVGQPAERAWSDDRASILPYVLWENVLNTGS